MGTEDDHLEVKTKRTGRELVSVLWFVLVSFVFFAPPLGIVVPVGALTALYGLVVLISSTVLLLSLIAQKGKKKRVE
ncbi:hypothetical protein [Armatimonas sp.]|uniref:hypothetical protein n=1 Tax=Armatimonas sp. TaxID=1872638 RepID=UPI0037511070